MVGEEEGKVAGGSYYKGPEESRRGPQVRGLLRGSEGRWPVVKTGVVGCKVRRHQRLSEAGVELLKKGTREVLRQDDCAAG